MTDTTTGVGFYVFFSGWIAFAFLAIAVNWRRICAWVGRRLDPPPARRPISAPHSTVRVLPSRAQRGLEPFDADRSLELDRIER